MAEMRVGMIALDLSNRADNAAPPCNPATPLPVIFCLGQQAYQVNGKLPQPVTDAEDSVLQAFIGLPAMSEKNLVNRSGVSSARNC